MKKIILIICLAFMYSCKDTSIYNETKPNFENNRWLVSSKTEFNFELNQSNDVDFYLNIAHVFGSENKNFKVNVVLSKKEGNDIVYKQIPITLTEKNCMGDMCDSTLKLLEGQRLEKGTYSLTIEPVFNAPFVPNIISIGVKITNTISQ